MKIKNVFITLGVTAAMGFGAFAGIKANRGEVKSASAATNYKSFYLDCSAFDGWDSESICLGTWNGTVNTYTEAKKIAEDYWVVSIDITGLSLVEFYRCSPGNTGIRWNKSSYTEDFASKNLCKITNWDESSTWSSGEVSAVLKTEANSWGTGTAMSETTNYSEYGYAAQWSLLNYTFIKDVEVKAVLTINGNDIWLDVDSCGASDLDGIQARKDNNNVEVNVTAAFNLYVKLGSSNEYYFEVLYENEALQFARDFVNAISTICENTKNNPVGAAPSAMSTAWANQNTAFSALSANAKTYLQNSDDYDHSELDALEEMYDYIIAKYTGLTNFLGRSSSGTNFGINPIVDDNSNSIVVIIVVASTISLVALGGFFFIKRKKESK